MTLPVPRRTASRVLAASLTLAAGAWMLGEQGVRVGRFTLAAWDWTYLAAGALALVLLAPPSEPGRARPALVWLALLAATAVPVDA